MTRIKNRICAIHADSIAQELGIEAGDCLISIDHTPVIDVFDYRMRMTVSDLVIEIETKSGERIEFDIEKDEYDELGLEFEQPLMDEGRHCKNKCVFCFIDQLPPNLRDTLYFKDDDLRLSFLTGNYVTLTNIKEEELDRLISYRLSPMNISVHTTDSLLRVQMMHNKNAGEILNQLRKITQAGIDVNCQIVLCPGINDGQVLEQTLADLDELGDRIKSIAMVPVGLTKFRKENRLVKLQPFGQSSAKRVVETVSNWQQIMLQNRGERIVFASDEFYIKAGMAFPDVDSYGDFPQLENGVGMTPIFIHEMKTGIASRQKQKNQAKKRILREKSAHFSMNESTGNSSDADKIKDENTNIDNPATDNPATDNGVILITGMDAKPYLEMFAEELSSLYEKPITVKGIPNRFFGETVTVAGLVTAGDIVHELIADRNAGVIEGHKSGKPLIQKFSTLMIPTCMLRCNEQVFLDDLSVSDVEKMTQMSVCCSQPTGEGLLTALDSLFTKNIHESNT